MILNYILLLVGMLSFLLLLFHTFQQIMGVCIYIITVIGNVCVSEFRNQMINFLVICHESISDHLEYYKP